MISVFSNIRDHSKLFSTNFEQTTMFRTKKGLRSGIIGSKSAQFVVGSYSIVRACLHEGGGPQVGEVTCGELPHLTCKRDHIKMRDFIDRRVTPPKRVTSPAWGPPLPCKQALTLTQPNSTSLLPQRGSNPQNCLVKAITEEGVLATTTATATRTSKKQ